MGMCSSNDEAQIMYEHSVKTATERLVAARRAYSPHDTYEQRQRKEFEEYRAQRDLTDLIDKKAEDDFAKWCRDTSR